MRRLMIFLAVFLATVLLSPPALAETASLLLDIRPSQASGTFSEGVIRRLLPTGEGHLYLVNDSSSGNEIWISDGTSAGTRPLRDICPGPCSSTVHTLGTIGNVALFFANEVLWRSDGTRPGTFAIAGQTLDDPRPCGSTSLLPNTAQVGGVLFFPGLDSLEGCELWRTDGTAAGTRRITTMQPNAFTSYLRDVTAGDGKLWFGALTDEGQGLYQSDGTEEGTVLVRSLPTAPAFLTAIGSRLFFVAPDENRGDELWVSDGTTAGTRTLTHFVAPRPFPDPDGFSEIPAFFLDIDGILYFLADDVTGGLDLWRSDGTEAGTRRVTAFGNAKPFATDFDERQVVKLGSRLLFVATDGLAGFRLWTSGGTPETTVALSGCPGGTCPTVASHFDSNFRNVVSGIVKLGGKAVFLGTRPGQPAAVWSTDGTGSGTRVVRDLCLGHCSSDPRGLTPLLGQAFFIARNPDPEHPAYELWRTDGTAQGTLRVASLGELVFSVEPAPRFDPVSFQGRILFDAANEEFMQLWASDGTPEGTGTVALAGRDGLGSDPRAFASDGSAVWFTAHDGTDLALWRSEGTAATTLRITSPAHPPFVLANGHAFVLGEGFLDGLLRLDAASGEPLLLTPPGIGTLAGLVPFGSGVAALFHKFGEGFSLWESDGTPAGTRKLLDLPFDPQRDAEMAVTGNELFFQEGSRLWRSDGTPAGTREVPSAGIGVQLSTLQRIGSRVFFVGGSFNGTRVWKIEGATGSPQLLLPAESSAGRDPFMLTVFQGALYFFARTENFDTGLWRSDGTAAGTVLLRTFQNPALPAIFADELTPLGNRLYFVIGEEQTDLELWSTDGTPAGTVLVRDIVPGPGSSSPSGLTATGDRLFFAAADEDHGTELWESDGTEAGTRMVHDIAPGVLSSQPEELTVAGGHLFFSADDGVHGREPWVLPLGGSGCQATAEALCLGGRFRVEAFWRDFQGGFGPGRAVSLTADTGYFWFFDPANVEVIVKALDGQGVNGHHWVFYGALSTVEYTLTVTDTATGAARRYVNPPGRLGSVGDTTAFGPLGAIGSASSLGPAAIEHKPIAMAGKAAAAPCVPSATRLCLQGGRFAVEADWRDFQGNAGKGMAVPLPGGDTGYFWFFGADNVEVVLKVLDGRVLNGKFWVFYGALSSVQYTLTVTDTETGQVKKYENPSGRLGSVADTGAF